MKKQQKSKAPKTTLQLLNALHAAAIRANTAALVIAPKEGFNLVFSDEGSRMSQLASINRLVKAGGRPVGFIRVSDRGQVVGWPLPSYKANEKVMKFLEQVAGECQKRIIYNGAVEARA